jgi:hypothetical protein
MVTLTVEATTGTLLSVPVAAFPERPISAGWVWLMS